MSIGQNHLVSKLEKNSKAMQDQRLIRVIAKKNKEGNYESEFLNESKCISVPAIGELSASEITAAMPHIRAMLAGAQDEIARELIVTQGCTSINDAQISVAECIKYLDDSSKGNRITSEYMSKWFEETYAEAAMEFIVLLCKFKAEELTADQGNVVVQKVNVLSSMFAGFASPKYSPDIPKCKAMIKFAEFLREENHDERMKSLVQRVQKVKAEKEAEMSADALGF